MAEEWKCPACENDGWVAVPQWADAAKQNIRILKVRCNCGIPMHPAVAGVITWEQLEALDRTESARPN